ncbi:MAG: hypothetical protein K2L64_01040 [Ureaplasma sp.]|nr:hypothetical protein [Ureaplasma sp.]
MKKVSKKIDINQQKNNNESNSKRNNDLLYFHFELVKNNAYDTYISFLKKSLLDDFSELLDKMFNNKEKTKNEKDVIKWN